MKISIVTLLLCFFIVAESRPTIQRYMRIIRRLVFAPEGLRYSNSVIFDENQGEVNREQYEKAYGPRGQALVEAYGKGLTKQELGALGYL